MSRASRRRKYTGKSTYKIRIIRDYAVQYMLQGKRKALNIPKVLRSIFTFSKTKRKRK